MEQDVPENNKNKSKEEVAELLMKNFDKKSSSNPAKPKSLSLDVTQMMNDQTDSEYIVKVTKKTEQTKEEVNEHLDELSEYIKRNNLDVEHSIEEKEPDSLDAATLMEQAEQHMQDIIIPETKPKPETQTKLTHLDGNILQKICEDKLKHIERQKGTILENKLREEIRRLPAPRPFIEAINHNIIGGKNALIAEIKKASPSKGVIRDDFEPGIIAREYAKSGATCISVLTDRPYFQGRDEYIDIVKRACELPVLRKDFILDVYQVVESRALGADCILLIMAALSDTQAKTLEQEAKMLGMDVLIEVHNEEELERALKLDSMLIGINNRDLKTLKIDLAITERMARKIPQPRTVVCESGIYSFSDISRINTAGARAFLVGESLMAQEDIASAVNKLMGWEK